MGGNVAENSGGAHCLKRGFTRPSRRRARDRHAGGRADLAGRRHRRRARPLFDLVGAFTGSEGTLGIATKIVVRLTPIPEAVTTLLAAFTTMGAGGAAVSAIIGSGVLPGAIEMMDALAVDSQGRGELPLSRGAPAPSSSWSWTARPVTSRSRPPPSGTSAQPPAPTRSGPRRMPPSGRRSVEDRAQVRVRRGRPDQPRLHHVQDGVVPRPRCPRY